MKNVSTQKIWGGEMYVALAVLGSFIIAVIVIAIERM